MNPKHPPRISPLQAWILAARPKTLPAAISPVLIGSTLAIISGQFKPLPAAAALAVSLLLQIGVNLANDYFDFKKGVDTENRLGPIRVTQSGLIPPRTVKRAMLGTLLAAGLCGFYLVLVGGWPILVLGITAILSALAYSGGPFPLASNGLGDVFVFVFFGPVAVCGTYFVQVLHLSKVVLIMSLPVGLLITAILVVNNLRDIATDQQTGKRTMAVMLGETGSRVEYLLLLAFAYLIPTMAVTFGIIPVHALAVLISLPFTIPVLGLVLTARGAVLNQALAGTARLTFIFSLLLSIGLWVGTK
ncbi:1,4-dihydroxy-2-naphthoate polyprenyltransferase [bacterium]|nr:1,4-dihydroxy-2-naphthoate polyprenyltransferase [bacterium]